MKGIATDGSSLYAEPVRAVFSGISRQMCEFHVKKEINKGVLKTVVHVRRELEKNETHNAWSPDDEGGQGDDSEERTNR